MRLAGSRCLGMGLIVLLSILAGGSQGQVTATEDSALAPIRFLPSGSFNPTSVEWNNAAMQSLRQGGGAVGDATSDPSAYMPINTVGQADFIGTDARPDATFPSWRGVANPSGLFANEYGTGLVFPLRLQSTTTKFKLSNLDNIVSSNDPNDLFSGLSHSAQALNYAYNRIGIDYGPDGLPNTADDIVYANGESGNLPVNELLTSGIGTYLPTDNLSSTDQGDIDQSVANFFSQNPLTQISNEYLLYDDSGNLLADVTKSVTVTPEPAALSCLGVLVIPLLRKRR